MTLAKAVLLHPIFLMFFMISLLAVLPVPHGDTAGHALAFFTLYLFLRCLYPLLPVKYVIALLMFYSLSIETVQYFIPGRDASLRDLAANGIGMGFAIPARILLEKLKVCTKPFFLKTLLNRL